MTDPRVSLNKSTILYIHSSDEMYGSDRVLLQLVSGLDRNRFEPIVILPSDVQYDGKLSKALDKFRIKHYSVNMGVLRRRYFTPIGITTYIYYLLSGIFDINRIINAHDVRIIHSNTSAVVSGAILARLRGIPHVWHIHEIIEKPKLIKRIIYPFIRNFSDQIITISQAVAEPITTPECQSKIHTIWNGIDTNEFSNAVDGQIWREQWNVGKEAVLFGVVGRISHWKGQELFFEAAAHAVRDCDNLFFILVGDPVPGEESRLTDLRRLASDLQIEKQVIVIPFTDNMPQIMRAIDILVLPSTLPEPLGLVVLEAMASGHCVIAAAHGGPLESVEHNETGLLVPANDVEALSTAMIELANDPKRRETMGRNGRRRVENQFSLPAFRKRIEQIYNEILKNIE